MGDDGNQKKKRRGRGGGGRVFERFRSHIILKSRIWLTLLMFATLCVIFRWRVLIIYVGAYYTRGAGSRRAGCKEEGGVGGGEGG